MQTSVRRFLWAGVAALVALVAVPVASAFGAGSVTTTFTRTSDWGSGHEVRVTITNGSDATVNTWRVEFDLPAGTTISSFWDADVTRSGNHYVATKKSWAGPLAPGAVAELGLHRHRRLQAPTGCTINGAPCGGGPTPPTTAPPTTAPPTAGPRRRRRPHRRRRRTRPPAARSSSATSSSGASTSATTTSRTSTRAARRPS